MATTARLFQNGGSQAVRLPAEFRFDGDEVFISRDVATGDVILSDHPRASTTYWQDLFAMLDSMKVDGEDDDLSMAERPMNAPLQDRDVFGEGDDE
ncbi:MAG: antitoxin [Thermomicrobiales bacterium]